MTIVYFRKGKFIYKAKAAKCIPYKSMARSSSLTDKGYAKYTVKQCTPISRYNLKGQPRNDAPSGITLGLTYWEEKPLEVYLNFEAAIASGKRPKNFTGTWNKYTYSGMLFSSHEYVQGIEHGRAAHYDPRDGRLFFEQYFVAGKRHGITKKWEDGVLVEEQEFACDLPHGNYDAWWPNGQPKTKGQFSCGKFTGKWINWYGDGTIESTRNYVCGSLHGELHKYKNGKIVKKQKYVNGILQQRFLF